MASSMDALAATLISRSKTIVNNDLKKICKEEGQIQSGNKAQLQSRVIAIINGAVSRNDMDAIQRLRYRLHNRGDAPPSSSTTPATPTFPTHSSPNMPSYGQNGYAAAAHYGPSHQQHALANTRSIFKSSPFFETQDMLLNDVILEASPSHRQTTTRTLTITSDTCARMRADPTLKLLLFSAMDQPLSNYNMQQDVAFPAQIEVKVNGDEIKANFKGLKNKPGSTRPADITDYVRKSPANYRNTIQITYALTQKESSEKYNLYVYLVKKHSVDDLARRIMKRNVITKQSVMNEMRKKANDPDIEVGSVNMSLKDPISTLRISIPCRSTICNHNQCFDAESFLQLQEQAPTWQCPICNKTVSFQGLAVDQYVQEILDTVPKGTDQVTVEPDGQWSFGNAAEKQTPRTNGYGPSYDDDSDEDLVDITDSRLSAIKSEAVPTPQSLARTPISSSREPSSAPRAGSKRTSEVIDLTLSDDDEPVRPAKKVAYPPSSLPDPSRRYQVPAFGSPSVPMRPQAHSRNSMSSSLRFDAPTTPTDHNVFGSYRPPPPRASYPGQGTSAYPQYLDSSP